MVTNGGAILAGETVPVNSIVSGNAAANRLSGGAGNDRIFGGSGSDRIEGGPGNDLLAGAWEADILEGGSGRDVFRFAVTSHSRPGATDTIIGFEAAGGAAGDRIDISRIDADTTRSGDQAFTFAGTGPGGTATGDLRLIEKGGTTFVLGNIDDDTSPEFKLYIADGGAAVAGDYTGADFIL